MAPSPSNSHSDKELQEHTSSTLKSMQNMMSKDRSLNCSSSSSSQNNTAPRPGPSTSSSPSPNLTTYTAAVQSTSAYHAEQFRLFKLRTDAEKRTRRRRQNNESSRRSRERKRAEIDALQKAHVSAQLRIHHLEELVERLSTELGKHDPVALQKAMNSTSSLVGSSNIKAQNDLKMAQSSDNHQSRSSNNNHLNVPWTNQSQNSNQQQQITEQNKVGNDNNGNSKPDWFGSAF